jgi:hypothetical protein
VDNHRQYRIATTAVTMPAAALRSGRIDAASMAIYNVIVAASKASKPPRAYGRCHPDYIEAPERCTAILGCSLAASSFNQTLKLRDHEAQADDGDGCPDPPHYEGAHRAFVSSVGFPAAQPRFSTYLLSVNTTLFRLLQVAWRLRCFWKFLPTYMKL